MIKWVPAVITQSYIQAIHDYITKPIRPFCNRVCFEGYVVYLLLPVNQATILSRNFPAEFHMSRA